MHCKYLKLDRTKHSKDCFSNYSYSKMRLQIHQFSSFSDSVTLGNLSKLHNVLISSTQVIHSELNTLTPKDTCNLNFQVRWESFQGHVDEPDAGRTKSLFQDLETINRVCSATCQDLDFACTFACGKFPKRSQTLTKPESLINVKITKSAECTKYQGCIIKQTMGSLR